MKQQLASVLLILISLFGLAAGAKAQTRREVVVNIPYEFVAAGRTLPAGRYTVSRISENRYSGLIITNDDTRSSVFVLPNQFESQSGVDAKVRLEKVSNMYFLSGIVTVDGVYTLPLPRSAVLMAKSAHADAMSASGTH